MLASCAGILLLANNPHGGEHLKDLLVGQILWVHTTQLFWLFTNWNITFGRSPRSHSHRATRTSYFPTNSKAVLWPNHSVFLFHDK